MILAIYDIKERGILDSRYTEGYVNNIVEALEKQVPKKPINETGYYRDNKCPSCLKPIKSGKGSSSHYRNNWCNNCGQAIDWSE